jgi:cell division protein FtsI (penicillin-binding protein 3)
MPPMSPRVRKPVHNLHELHETQRVRTSNFAMTFVALVMLAMLVVVGRVGQLKLNPDPRIAPAVGSPYSSQDEIARRGDLLDRRGRLIATSMLTHSLFIDPQVVRDLNTIAVDLGSLLDLDPAEIDRQLFTRRDRRYVVVCDQLEEWQVNALKQNKARFPGVGLTPRLMRVYPNEQLAASLIGTVGFDHDGLAGAEHRFESNLKPTNGHMTYLRDANRNTLWVELGEHQPASNGRDVQLSIDLWIQNIAEARLHEAIAQHNAGGGRIVVADPQTGEILALYDMLNPRPGWDEQTTDDLRDASPALARNRCVTDPYEPGSTFKPFVWAVATELGLADPEEELPTPEHTGYRTSYGRLIRDTHYYGPSSWRRVLVKSLNSGMAIVAERMSHRQMQQTLDRFGFGHRTNCGIPGETVGIITSPAQWSDYTQSSVSFGHEIAVTPVQMVRGFCAFCRDGTVPTLRLTPVPRDDDSFQIVQRAVEPRTARLTRDVIRTVMHEGTGRRAQSEFYELFGKSGTAQLPKKDGSGYHEDRYVSSFIAGAPFEHPRVVVLCVIDDPDRSRGHYGGAIAGPVVRDVIDQTLAYLGVPPDKRPDDESVAAAF